MDSAVLELILKVKDEASSAIDKVKDKLEKMEKTAGTIGKALGIGLAAIGAGAGAAAVGLFKLGDGFDSAFDKIAVGTGASGLALEELQSDFRAVFGSIPTDMDSASTAIADWNTKVGATGETLQDLSATAIEMSRLTGGDLAANIDSVSKLMNQWGVSAEDGSALMDKLFLASQATGTGIDKISGSLTKFGPALQEMGFGLDESVALLASLEKSGVDADAAMAGLRKGVANFAKDGISASDGIKSAFDAIQNASNSTDAIAIAMEVFGAKAGPDLAAAIRKGSLGVNDLVKQLGVAEGAVLKTADETADFGERFQVLKNKGMLALEPLALKTLEFATILAEKLTPHVQRAAEIMSVAIPAAVTLIGNAWNTHGKPFVDGVIEVATTVGALLLPKIETLVSFFMENESAWQAAAVGIGTVLAGAMLILAINAGLAAVAMIAAAAPVIALVAVVAALGAGIFLLIKHWDDITEKVPALGVAFDVVRATISAVVDATEGIIKGLFKVIDGQLESILGIFKIFKGIVTGDWDLMFEGMEDVASGMLKTIEGVIDLGLAPVEAIITNFKEIGIDSVQSMMDFARNKWPEIATLLSGPFFPLVALATNGFGIRDKFIGALGEMKSTTISVIGSIVSEAMALPGKIAGFAFSMFSAGKTFMGGLWDGIKAGFGAAGDVAASIAETIGSAIKGWINSNVIDVLNRSVEFDFSVLGKTVGVNPPDIPHLKTGGIITGPTLALLGDNAARREAVVPLERAGEFGFGKSGGNVYNFPVPAGWGLDDDDFARRMLDSLRRVGADI